MNLILLGLVLGSLTIAVGAFLIWRGKLKILNPIRAFAVLVVAIVTGYVMVVGWRLIDILSSPDWCARALGAEKASPGRTLDGLKACINLMGDQIDALAIDSHISQGVVAMCLLTLIVIVIAGGRLNLDISKTGAKASIGKEEAQAIAAAGAEQAAEAAKDEAKDIASGAAPVGRPEGMPEARPPLGPKTKPPPGEEGEM